MRADLTWVYSYCRRNDIRKKLKAWDDRRQATSQARFSLSSLRRCCFSAIDKALLRFILTGNTSFWSRPEVAYRVGFGTAPWRCVDRCQAIYFSSVGECMPDCTTNIFCTPGGTPASDTSTPCCALNLCDQSYTLWVGQQQQNLSRSWCTTYPAWAGSTPRPSVCEFNVYSARGVDPPLGADDPFLAVSCKRVENVATFHVNGTAYRNDTVRRIMYYNAIKRRNATANVVNRV
ncbi:hypothetical protein VOLCADRAFT_95845 [Volvox carteri f. nagariensis]|uniref:Uncharacterized protein n=1 Tax=Volvox carteri f. nagariensis TaxID=3068 RepID=D8U8I9_VOLCA|nr:uncharacterized protein VOLCADRAFT_95845 [Volvox carteri f. nagariensis]EFJ43989.1 hypothetical protein VOLCADRAFT_95845 [Volvox carteri f. nagariensis]|eukprot:XP_002955001.1 hypothetical protein VOLCADRAFT_95845 [Volvox carteri f. nagariensis]